MATAFVGLNLPKELPYVGLALASTLHLLCYQTYCVLRSRMKAGVKYPQVFADFDEAEKSLDKMRFNCYQRAHQNTLESLPIVYLSTIITGLKYPVFAAVMCGLWTLSRFRYTMTYGSGVPSRRGFSARAGYMVLMSLIGASTYITAKSSWSLLTQ